MNFYVRCLFLIEKRYNKFLQFLLFYIIYLKHFIFKKYIYSILTICLYFAHY